MLAHTPTKKATSNLQLLLFFFGSGSDRILLLTLVF